MDNPDKEIGKTKEKWKNQNKKKLILKETEKLQHAICTEIKYKMTGSLALEFVLREIWKCQKWCDT